VNEVAAFRRVLAEAGIVYVDAGVLALHLVGDPGYLPLTRAILGGLRDREFTALTSAITIYQLLVEPYRSGHEATAERVEVLVAALQGLEIVPVSATIARQAAQVKAQIGGGLPRAIQIATALAGDSEIYVTRRSTLRRIAGLGVAQLDAYRQSESAGLPAAET
jgi:predicted nucleic acid-binding protein